MKFSNSELRLIAALLSMAENIFSNHGCNDLYSDFWDEVRMSPEEQDQLIREMQEWNGDKENPWPEKLVHIRDSSLMLFYSDKLRGAEQRGTE